MSEPLGVTLCNPCCIEHSHGEAGILYVGEIPSSHPVYRQFRDTPHGFRATVKLLRAYQKRDDIRTIGEAINRFSPPSDGNPTAQYALNVADECGVAVDAAVDFDDYMHPMLRAMSTQECGAGWFSSAQIALGISLAGNAR